MGSTTYIEIGQMLSTQEKSVGKNFALFCFFSNAHTRRFPLFSRDGRRLRANVPFSFPSFTPKCQKMRFLFWKATLRTHANGESETKYLGKRKKIIPECCQSLPPHYSGNADISFSPYLFFKWDNDSPTRFCLIFLLPNILRTDLRLPTHVSQDTWTGN